MVKFSLSQANLEIPKSPWDYSELAWHYVGRISPVHEFVTHEMNAYYLALARIKPPSLSFYTVKDYIISAWILVTKLQWLLSFAALYTCTPWKGAGQIFKPLLSRCQSSNLSCSWTWVPGVPASSAPPWPLQPLAAPCSVNTFEYPEESLPCCNDGCLKFISHIVKIGKRCFWLLYYSQSGLWGRNIYVDFTTYRVQG